VDQAASDAVNQAASDAVDQAASDAVDQAAGIVSSVALAAGTVTV
jgi:hypothetical protein